LTYETPVARPFLSVNTSLTMALDMSSRLPVFNAGITRQEEDEKSAYTLQLRPHSPQKKQEPLSLLPGNRSVNMDPLPGITFTPAFAAPFMIKSSGSLGFGGFRNMPSGSFSKP